MSDDISTAELSRVKEGVCRGRRHYSGAVITGSHEISPAPGQHPTVLLIPQLSAVPVVTKSHEQTCRALDDHSDIILKEYLACRNSKVIQWKENDLPVNQEEGKKSSWRVLHLLNQGFWQDIATEMCPGTTRLLKSLDILQGCMFGNAFFSVITQGTVIEPHTGPSNARHRLQLPLQIPFEDDCGSLRVMDHELTWRQAFCFDDSFVHSATYRGKSLRVVFVVDLWHPDLSALERKVITQLYAATQLDQTKVEASGI
jgi:aspartyl/asparaginyl beta-hydroxylase (cupin superfamily)